VRGRAADVLTFPTERGDQISIPPLVLEIDHLSGVELAQVVQDAPTSLRVRLRTAADVDQDQVWERIQGELANLLAGHGLRNVTIRRAEEPPEQSRSGKYRTVIPLT
jgi:phenylacetate-CoA ligase